MLSFVETIDADPSRLPSAQRLGVWMKRAVGQSDVKDPFATYGKTSPETHFVYDHLQRVEMPRRSP